MSIFSIKNMFVDLGGLSDSIASNIKLLIVI